MATVAAPLAAAAFAAGIWLATWSGTPFPLGWVLLLLGAGVVASGWAVGRTPRLRPDLLAAAGLVGAPEAPSDRERLIDATRDEPRDGSPGAGELVPAGPRPSWRLVAAVLLGLVLSGWGWAAIRRAAPDRSILLELRGASVRAELTLEADTQEGTFGWSALATVRSLATSQGAVALHEPIWLEGRDRAPPLAIGDRLTVSGVIEVPEVGGFAEFLRGRGVAGVLRVGSLHRNGGASNPVLRLAEATRRGLARSIGRVFGPREAGLLMGLSLGDTSHLDPGVREDFRATGLGHLVAVSGENVAMFLAPLIGLAMALRLTVRGRFAIGLAGLAFFVLLTRAEPSVLRAALMAGLTLLGALRGRRRSAAAVLGTTCLLLLVWDPSLVASIGFQLSVAATAGIVAFAGPIARRLPGPGWLRLAFGATLGAQAGVTPLLLVHFHVVPTVGILANLLAFPAVAPAMLLGLAAAAANLVIHPIGEFLATLAHLPVAYLIGLADRMATLPFPSLTSARGLVPVLVGFPALAYAVWRLRRRPLRSGSGHTPRRRARLVLAVLLVPGFVWIGAARAGGPGALTVHFFDVGQGDGALVQSPGGANVLIDGGPETQDVAVKLASLGVHRLDVVVATHPHKDHVAGLPAVLARFPVGMVLDPGCFGDSPFYADFLRAVRDEGIPVRHPGPGEVVRVGDLRLETLGPDRCYHGTNSDPNNDSLVLRVAQGDAAVLFPGDAEEPAQERVLDTQPAELAADVLKVPHHGGDTSLPEFLLAIRGTVAIVSVGQPNPYGHPSPNVIAELGADGMKVYRTDQVGDVVVTFDRRGIVVASDRAA